jgi:hypothetical protein
MQRTVTSWDEFCDAWDGVHNFLMADECVPFSFDMPPLARVVSEMRDDPAARISPGIKGSKLLLEDIAEQFRATPVEEALAKPFGLAHFRLSVFDHPGGFLYGFQQQVLEPWEAALTKAGFTFDRCYPIIFISGPQSATNYHMDFSHVLAWQIYGQKRFCGLKAPGRWAPWRVRVNYSSDSFERPLELKEEDELCYNMPPGSVLWNALLTPHWVEAGNEAAMSVNISHGGLRLHGRLCPFERELEDHRAASPEGIPAKPQGQY